MKKWAIVAVIVAGLPVAGLAGLSCASKSPELGLEAGRLQPCPDTPNCVCSETGEGPAAIAPLAYDGPVGEAWQRLAAAVEDIGGEIVTQESAYLRATFTSRIFRFVDDLECRLDAENGVIHVRSASRVGHSDLGVNRKRVEALRAAFQYVN